MVHRREIDGREIVLGNHGALWGNAMTWFDHETGSVWSQPIGQAILGPLEGTTLELLPSTLTRWSDWKETHPDTFALDAATSLSSGRFSLEMMAVVVELNEQSIAYPIPDVRDVGVVNSELDGVPFAVTSSASNDNWAVFSRTLDDRVVELALEDGVLVEVGGDSRWDANTGVGIDGTTEQLDHLPGFTSFPADYTTFYPNGSFWQVSGLRTVQDVLSS